MRRLQVAAGLRGAFLLHRDGDVRRGTPAEVWADTLSNDTRRERRIGNFEPQPGPQPAAPSAPQPNRIPLWRMV